jgi:hypothetical protein
MGSKPLMAFARQIADSPADSNSIVKEGNP